VIGLGFGRRHIQAYQRLPGVRVVALVAQNTDRLEQARLEYGIPTAYTDDATLYEREQLDLVSICTPDRLHAEQALRALWAGVHVLCEKPIATTLEEASQLVHAVRET
jgi:predicted dehydrogenase